MKKYTLQYQKDIPKPEGAFQEDILEKFLILQREALGIFITKNNHFKSCFIENGIQGSKTMLAHKLHDLESGGKIIDGKQVETLTECFLDTSNYAIMGAIQASYTFDGKEVEQCKRCTYEIEEKDGKQIKMRCVICANILQVRE